MKSVFGDPPLKNTIPGLTLTLASRLQGSTERGSALNRSNRSSSITRRLNTTFKVTRGDPAPGGLGDAARSLSEIRRRSDRSCGSCSSRRPCAIVKQDGREPRVLLAERLQGRIRDEDQNG